METIPKPLPRHEYPLVIKLFAVVVIGLCLYAAYLSPAYVYASKNLKTADLAVKNMDYENAIELYLKVLETVPSSKDAKIGISVAIFSNGDTEDDEAAFYYLQDVTLHSSDWERISAVMPAEYEEYFVDVDTP